MEEVQLCAGHVLVFLVLQISTVWHDFDDCQLLALVPHKIFVRAIETKAFYSALRHLSWCELPVW